MRELFSLKDGKATGPDRLDYSSDWIVNSGCSKYMTGDESKFLSKSEYQEKDSKQVQRRQRLKKWISNHKAKSGKVLEFKADR